MTPSPSAEPDFSREGASPDLLPYFTAGRAEDWPELDRLLSEIVDPYDLSFVAGLLNVAGLNAFHVGLGSAATTRQRTLIAHHRMAMAWHARTEAPAEEVTAYQWHQFREGLVSSERVASRLVAEDPGNDLAWIVRILNARGLQLGRAEVARRYQRFSRVAPHHYQGQSAMLEGLYPKWGGSWEEAHEFASKCAHEAPAGAINGVLIADFYLERRLSQPGSSAQGDPQVARSPEVLRELTEAAQRSVLHNDFPKPYGWVPALSKFAFLFCQAGDYAGAAPFFRAMGRFGSRQVWEELPGDATRNFIRNRGRALYGLADYHYNGATAMWHTTFAVQGSADDVTKYLSGVCRALGDLPLDRLLAEKSILQTEAAGRSAVGGAFHRRRYGARGQGLVGYPELGVLRLTEKEVTDWARSRFTRDNAALWLVGEEIPAGLRIELAAGARIPVQRQEPVLTVAPAYFAEGGGGMAIGSVVPSSAAARVFAAVLEKELFRALRQESAYSYVVSTDYGARPDGLADLLAVADALPDKQDALVGEFVDVLARLEAKGLREPDIAVVRTKMLETLDHPDFDVATVPARAADLLSGRPAHPVEVRREQLAAVTAEQVTAAASEALANALVWVPEGHRLDWAGFEPAPERSRFETRAGRRYGARSGEPFELVMGPDGVSIAAANDGYLTVAYEDCVAMLSWPDGARRLTGGDGISVHVEPTLFEIEPAELAKIDASVNASVVISMAARDREAIPQPRLPEKPSLRKPIRHVVIAWLLAAVLITMTVQFGNAWTPADGELADKLILWLFIGSAGVSLVAGLMSIALLTQWRDLRRAQ